MVKRIKFSQEDKKKITSTSIDPASVADDFFDYYGVVVHKPWGYEYLAFQNEFVAAWVLLIKHGFQTSFHCHPRKKTTLTVLSGRALVKTHSGEVEVSSGEALLLEKGVFHSTKAISPEGIMILETETPTNKRDLVRLEDQYGREAKSYEGAESRIFLGDGLGSQLPHFCGDQLVYGVPKKIGTLHVRVVRYQAEEFRNLLEFSGGCGLAAILKGNISDSSGKACFDCGDIVAIEELKMVSNPIISQGAEFLLMTDI